MRNILIGLCWLLLATSAGAEPVQPSFDCTRADGTVEEMICVEERYRLRIAEIQARWGLIEAKGPFFFADAANPSHEIVATIRWSRTSSAVRAALATKVRT